MLDLILGGGLVMAQFLAVQIRLDRITIEQVPDQYRAEVEQILTALVD